LTNFKHIIIELNNILIIIIIIYHVKIRIKE